MELLKKYLNKKNLAKYRGYTAKINKLAEKYKETIKPEDIAKELLALRENKKMSSFDKTLRAMALAKNASSHVLGMTYYDVQLLGALALSDGEIAEMKTGEGKTLTCSAAVAANFAQGYKTHVVTANEYLAVRDQQTLAPLYDFLGITHAHNVGTMSKEEKREAYGCDVVYSVSSELGFDYLKDNLVYDINDKVQQISFDETKALIDEADFILIDEARTPLIISNPNNDSLHDKYQLIINIVNKLKKMEKAPPTSVLEQDIKVPGDFWLDEKIKQSYFNDGEEGFHSLEALVIEAGLIEKAEDLYSNANSWILREVKNAINAKYLYIRDKDYIVRDDEIVIIDSNTGRLAEGRSWSEGLAQAIQAKEGVTIQAENSSSGSISIQNYFRLYARISGMSGTIITSSEEFEFIYNASTIDIPKKEDNRRIDKNDRLFLNHDLKYKAIVKEIKERRELGQPILVGTVSVQESELISSLLDKASIPHYVLNAKNHLQEAQIIAQAGIPGAVTVATSMAGRGTDIILGGNQEAFKDLIKSQLEELAERREYLNNKHTIFAENIKLTRAEIEQQQLAKRLSYQAQEDQKKMLQELEQKNQELLASTNEITDSLEAQLPEGREIVQEQKPQQQLNFRQRFSHYRLGANYYAFNGKKNSEPQELTIDDIANEIPTTNPEYRLELGQATPDISNILHQTFEGDNFERYKFAILDKANKYKKSFSEGKDIAEHEIRLGLVEFNTSTEGDTSTDEHFEYISVTEKLLLLHHPLIISRLLMFGPAIFNRQLNVIENTILRQEQIINENNGKWKEKVKNAGGLCVIGCSRSESRRIDNQLIGRAGRQGDKGTSIFFLSLEDDWIRVFIEGKKLQFLEKMIKSEPYVESGILTSSFESSQRKSENLSYDGRKNTFQYDSAADDARKSVIAIRDEILKEPKKIMEYLKNTMIHQLRPLAHDGFFSHLEDKLKIENVTLDSLKDSVFLMPYEGMSNYAKLYLEDPENEYATKLIEQSKDLDNDILERIEERVTSILTEIGEDDIQYYSVMCLQDLDRLWGDMLIAMDEIRQGVSFRQVAQKNPLYEFKNLCFEYFESLINNFQLSLVGNFQKFLEMKREYLLNQSQQSEENAEILLDEMDDEEDTPTEGFFSDTEIQLSSTEESSNERRVL